MIHIKIYPTIDRSPKRKGKAAIGKVHNAISNTQENETRN